MQLIDLEHQLKNQQEEIRRIKLVQSFLLEEAKMSIEEKKDKLIIYKYDQIFIYNNSSNENE